MDEVTSEQTWGPTGFELQPPHKSHAQWSHLCNSCPENVETAISLSWHCQAARYLNASQSPVPGQSQMKRLEAGGLSVPRRSSVTHHCLSGWPKPRAKGTCWRQCTRCHRASGRCFPSRRVLMCPSCSAIQGRGWERRPRSAGVPWDSRTRA